MIQTHHDSSTLTVLSAVPHFCNPRDPLGLLEPDAGKLAALNWPQQAAA